MNEVILSPHHIEDAAGLLDDAVNQAFSISEQQTFYQPDQTRLPRPDFALMQAQTLATGAAREYGHGLQLSPKALGHFPNLRVIAAVKTRDQRLVFLPGVVLPSHNTIGALASDVLTTIPDRPLSDMQQLLLDQLFTLQNSDPAALTHADRRANTAEIAHLSLAAASQQPHQIHTTVHQLASDGQFAQQLSKRGVQHFQVNGRTRVVKNVIIPASQTAAIYTFPNHQPTTTEQSATVRLSPPELAAGMILAATTSRGIQPNVARNFAAIADQST